jgi:hypothetical protein
LLNSVYGIIGPIDNLVNLVLKASVVERACPPYLLRHEHTPPYQ